jgi:hypothetical protein
VIDGKPAARLAGEKCLHGVHRAYAALDHRQVGSFIEPAG